VTAHRLSLQTKTTGRCHTAARLSASRCGADVRCIRWHPVDEQVAARAGELGRTWLPSHRSIDSADLAIAPTALLLGADLLTLNLRHFPMFEGLRRPY